MSDQTRDADAAAATFLDIFKSEDKEKKSELTKIFLKYFLKNYRKIKVIVLEKGRALKSSRNNPEDFNQLVCESFNVYAFKLTEIIKLLPAPTYIKSQERAEDIGTFAGGLLAVIDFGLTDPRFDTTFSIDRLSGSKVRSNVYILAAAQQLANAIKSNHRDIKTKFLKARIGRIARKHAGKLTDEQKRLFASLAALFV